MGALLREGFEHGGGVNYGGWSGAFGFAEIITSGGTFSIPNPATDAVTGMGGMYFFSPTILTAVTMGTFLPRSAREFWLAGRWYSTTDSFNISILFELRTSDGLTSQVSLHHSDTTTQLLAKRGSTTLQTSASGAWASGDGWVDFHMRVYIDNTNGEFQVFKNGDFSAPIINLSATDTQNSATFNNAENFRISSQRAGVDDIRINDATVFVSRTAGTVAVGNTLTGNVSATTCIVTAILEGSATGDAVLQVHRVRVGGTTAWNDPLIDPWLDDTQLSNGSGWTANVLIGTTFKGRNSGPAQISYMLAKVPTADTTYADQELEQGGATPAGNAAATGSISAITPPATGVTITISGVTLLAAGGARTSGNNDYNDTLGTGIALSAEITAALNDTNNSFDAVSGITAVDGVGSVDLTAISEGTLGNGIALSTSNPTVYTLSGATLTGGTGGSYAYMPDINTPKDGAAAVASYLTTTGANQKVLFGLTDLNLPNTIVLSLTADIHWVKDGAGIDDSVILLENAGNEYMTIGLPIPYDNRATSKYSFDSINDSLLTGTGTDFDDGNGTDLVDSLKAGVKFT